MTETVFDPNAGIKKENIFTADTIGMWLVPGGFTLTDETLAAAKTAMGNAVQLGWLQKETGSIKPFDGASSEIIEGAQGVITTLTKGAATRVEATLLEILNPEVLKLVMRTDPGNGGTKVQSYVLNPNAQAAENGFCIKAKMGDQVIWVVLPKAQVTNAVEIPLASGAQTAVKLEITANTVTVGTKIMSALVFVESVGK